MCNLFFFLCLPKARLRFKHKGYEFLDLFVSRGHAQVRKPNILRGKNINSCERTKTDFDKRARN